jgi:hypothetical protein
MTQDQAGNPVPSFGSWNDADRLRRWAFLQRTPQQRLEWLIQALELGYQSGALKARPVSES